MAAAAEKPEQLRNSSGNPVSPDLWKCQRHYEIPDSIRKFITPKRTGKWSMNEKVLCINGYTRFSFVFIMYWKQFLHLSGGRNIPELNRACLYCLCLTSQTFILTLCRQSGMWPVPLSWTFIWPRALPGSWFVSGWDLYLQQLPPPLLHFPQRENLGDCTRQELQCTLNRFPICTPKNAAPGVAMIFVFPAR